MPSQLVALLSLLLLSGACSPAVSSRHAQLAQIHVADPWADKLVLLTQRVRARGFLHGDLYSAYLASHAGASLLYERSMAYRPARGEELSAEQAVDVRHHHIFGFRRGYEEDLFDHTLRCHGQETEIVATLIVEAGLDVARYPFCYPPEAKHHSLTLFCVERVACEGFTWERSESARDFCTDPRVRKILQEDAEKARRDSNPLAPPRIDPDCHRSMAPR